AAGLVEADLVDGRAPADLNAVDQGAQGAAAVLQAVAAGAVDDQGAVIARHDERRSVGDGEAVEVEDVVGDHRGAAAEAEGQLGDAQPVADEGAGLDAAGLEGQGAGGREGGGRLGGGAGGGGVEPGGGRGGLQGGELGLEGGVADVHQAQ